MSVREARVKALYRGRVRSPFLRATVLILGALVAYAWFLVVDVRGFLSVRRLHNLERFASQDAVPYPMREGEASLEVFLAWVRGLLEGGGLEALQATFWIAVAAIVLAGGVALVLAPFGARSLMTCDPYVVESEGTDTCTGWLRWVPNLSRALCIFLRAIPEYVWAFLLMAMLPQTAWPAILALAIHNAGILGRLGSDTIENLEPGPLRSLRFLGTRRRDLALHAVLPVAMPRFLLYFFYRFETCVREATVLGMLGIASLGASISEARARQRYDEMLLLVALGAGIVLLADLASHLARRWVRRAT